MDKLSRTTVLTLATLAALAPAVADTGLPDDDLTVVLSASRLAQDKSLAPVAVTVLTRDVIQASGAQDLHEVLRLVPGFLAAARSGRTTMVTNHGLGDQFSRRLQVLIDGRSVYLPSFGGVPWADMPITLDDIERIEVVRGPNTVSFGSNAFLGVINITTRRTAPLTEVRAASGSQDSQRVGLRHVGGTSAAPWQFSAGHRDDEGFDATNDGKRTSYANAQFSWSAAGSTFDLQFGGARGMRRDGAAPDPADPATLLDPERKKFLRTGYALGRWSWAPDADRELRVQVAHSVHDVNDRYSTALSWFPPPLDSVTPIDASIAADRTDLDVEFYTHAADGWRTVLGASLRHDALGSPFYLSGAEPTNDVRRAFLDNEVWLGPDWMLHAAVAVESSNMVETQVSPRLAINHRLAAGHTLRIGASRGVRTPFVFEEACNTSYTPTGSPVGFPLFICSGQLEPETIETREFGWLGSFPALHLSTDLRVFEDRVERLISRVGVPFPLPGLPTYEYSDFANTDAARVRGAEFELVWHPASATRVQFSYAYTDITSADVGDVYSHSAPRHAGNLLLMQDITPAHTASLMYHQVGAMQFLDLGDRLPDVRRLDLRLGSSATARERAGWGYALVAQNLLDEHADFKADNDVGRRYFVELHARY